MPRVINNDCVACGSCLPECAFDAISEGDIYKIDPNKCTDCGACEPVCPSNAIHPAWCLGGHKMGAGHLWAAL